MCEAVVLASQSPRRSELLRQLGVQFSVLSVDVPECRAVGEGPQAYVSRLAGDKAAAGGVKTSLPVLGADTIVVVDDEVLEKPKDREDFERMMALLSNREHRVVTAVALWHNGQSDSVVCQTVVRFTPVTEALRDRYWASGEPRDKAGGYGIQGFGAALVAHIEGSYSNVVGLPLFETAQLLDRKGISIWNANE